MSKFAEECKKRIAEAGVEPRKLKIEYKALDPKLIEWGTIVIPQAMKIEKDYFKEAIERMVEEFKNPSECQKLYEANLQLEEVKKEANYWETKCRKINKILVKCKAENKELSNVIVDLDHENAHLKNKYEEILKKEAKFETSYTKKHSELVKEAADLREEKGNLIRNCELLNEHIETIENNTSVFIDEINTLWGEIVNIDLESEEGKEKFKELQIQVAKSKNLLDLAFSIK
ncbi:hypothetical protein P7A61_04225 [Clostridium perfringens]|nr:hypothetical protein [Clostridium perfringens]